MDATKEDIALDGSVIFKGTVLEQDTYRLLRPRSRAESKGAYTPFHISTWEFAPEASGFDARGMYLHEFSHALEIFENRNKKRLFKKNYGYLVSDFSPSAYDIEMWVMGLQQFLCQSIFGYDSMTEEVIVRVRNSFAVQVDVPLDVFRSRLQKSVAFHESRGLDYYVNQWKALCQYVKDNRKPEERDLLFELLGISFG